MNEERSVPSKRQRGEKLLAEGKERFLITMESQLRQLDDLYVLLEYEVSSEHAGQWYRILHTMKGSAPVFGLSAIGKVAESLLHEWEWTQSELAPSLGAMQWSIQAEASLKNSRTALHQLKLERDLVLRELQLKAQEAFGASRSQALDHCRILVIDDDSILRAYLVKRLELEGYLVDEAEDIDLAQRMLRESHYDLILLDLMMYPKSGYELFEVLQEDPTLKWIPLIVLSARDDLHDKVNCLMLGASDYLTKPFRYEELAARVYSLLNRTKNFEQMAFRDALTGVYNRRYFDHHIELELQRVARYPAPLTIAFIDIDRFKSINDTYGHAIGDIVLQGLAYLVQQRLRSTDVLARYGGEEFVVLLPNTTGKQAVKLLTGILQQARTQPVAQHEGQSYSITFSAGVAEWTTGWSVAQWVRTADEAMYEAKAKGRNRVLLAGQKETESEASEEPTPVRKRVLIVDDDDILRSIVASRLETLPIEIAEACDGEDAYRLLQRQPVDLCVLDGMMPRMDGLSLLKRVRQEPALQGSSMRVLMLSGRRREDDVTRALESGADDYLPKPFSLVELELRVKRLLGLDAGSGV